MTHGTLHSARALLPGEEIAIGRSGEAIVDLPAHLPSSRAAFFGSWRGKVNMSRFDEADEEIAREFGMLD